MTEGSAPPPGAVLAAAGPEGGDVDEATVGVGSIAAGGRYDDLVGMFSGASATSNGGAAGRIPCVGISFGVERLFSLLLAQAKARGDPTGRSKHTQVYVVSIGEGLLRERIAVCRELWQAGIKVRQCLVPRTAHR